MAFLKILGREEEIVLDAIQTKASIMNYRGLNAKPAEPKAEHSVAVLAEKLGLHPQSLNLLDAAKPLARRFGNSEPDSCGDFSPSEFFLSAANFQSLVTAGRLAQTLCNKGDRLCPR